MQTRNEIQVTTVPNLRLRAKRLWRVLRRQFAAPSEPQVPEGLRRDVGLEARTTLRKPADHPLHWGNLP